MSAAPETPVSNRGPEGQSVNSPAEQSEKGAKFSEMARRKMHAVADKLKSFRRSDNSEEGLHAVASGTALVDKAAASGNVVDRDQAEAAFRDQIYAKGDLTVADILKTADDSNETATMDSTTAQKTLGTQTPNTASLSQPDAAEAKSSDRQAQFDAIYDLYKNGTIDKAEYDAKISRLNQPLTTAQTPAQETVTTPAAESVTDTATEAERQSTAKEIMLDLGVDPTSAEGKMLFGLIDADPASADKVLDKVKQAKELQAKMEAIFKESGLQLDPKKAFNFALGEIAATYKQEMDAALATSANGEKGSAESRSKIYMILKALLLALGVVLYTAGAGLTGVADAAKATKN